MVAGIRNWLNHLLYSGIAKPILFAQDPEFIHDRFILMGRILDSNPLTKSFVSLAFNYKNKMLEQRIAGIKFANPVGLAAGFDKDALIPGLMADVGFGFTEVGSITAKPYEGNKPPRLKRFIDKKSIWVNYGLKNQGADAIHERLKGIKFPLPVGISIAKTNSKETTTPEKAIKDYLYTLKKFHNVGNYVTINTSCPNAFGGCQFHDPKLLHQLLSKVDKFNIKKPIFLKISPDLKQARINRIINVANKHKISGFICTNLTKDHSMKTGGFSGKLIEEKSNNQISYIYKKTKGKFTIIGVGGIFSAEDAYKKIRLGASLVQLITGMIYRGPSLIGHINHRLVKLLKRDGYKNISEAIGADNKQ